MPQLSFHKSVTRHDLCLTESRPVRTASPSPAKTSCISRALRRLARSSDDATPLDADRSARTTAATHVTGSAERRLFPRRESGCVVRFVPQVDQGLTPTSRAWLLHATRHRGHVVDISRSGICFTAPSPSSPGSQLWLRIEHRCWSTTVERSVRVVRAVHHDDLWHIVCCFAPCLSMAEAQSLSRLL